MDDSLLISIDSVQEIDDHAFVGRLLVGDVEAYRTVSVYRTPVEAEQAAAWLLAGILGPRLAGEEWRRLNGEMQHAPLRTELGSVANPSAEERPPRTR